jgi:uncharacterized protein (TIGR02996 family)
MAHPVDLLALSPSEAPFIRAIAEAPDEDLPRLIYADWLEEQGSPYGEFIRVQLQQEKGSLTPAERSLLLRRKLELEQALALDAWKRRFPLDVWYRRGFVYELKLEYRRWASLDRSRLGNLLQSLQSLLSQPCRFLALPVALRIVGDLDEGSEREFRLPSEFVGDLLALPWFANLDALALDNGTLIVDVETVRVVVTHSNLKGLKKLILTGHEVGDEVCRMLATFGQLDSLTTLQLFGTGTGDGGARVLAESARFAKFTELDLRFNRIGDEGARALAASEHLSALKKLKLHGNLIGPEGVAALKSRFGAVCLLPSLQRPGKSRPGDWYCSECGASNFASRDVCYECRSPRRRPRLREGDWLCPGCNAHNFASRQSCHRCKGSRPS